MACLQPLTTAGQLLHTSYQGHNALKTGRGSGLMMMATDAMAW